MNFIFLYQIHNSIGARLGFNIAPETAELARQMQSHFEHLPKERIIEEFNKIIHKSKKPGK